MITERMPGTRGVSLGFWVGVGSRDEAPGMLGSTHFLEHLLFKGTPSRTAFDIAQAFDAVGGESNALTAKEHTCYYARVLDDDTPMAVDVLADMVSNALLDPEHLEQERGVILEEIAMDQDDPTDVAFENFVEQLMGQNPPGSPDRWYSAGDYAGPAGCCVGTLQAVLHAESPRHLGGWVAGALAHRKPCVGCAHPLRMEPS